MRRDRREFETRRHNAITALEAQLSTDPDDSEQWLRLARIRIQQSSEHEALVALEHALWSDDATTTEMTLLELGWPWGETTSDPTARLYGLALTTVDPDGQVALISDLREQEGALRRRSSWILWRLAYAHGADQQELERTRGRLLASLDEGSLRCEELPAFVVRDLEGPTLEEWKTRELATVRARIEGELLET